MTKKRLLIERRSFHLITLPRRRFNLLARAPFRHADRPPSPPARVANANFFDAPPIDFRPRRFLACEHLLRHGGFMLEWHTRLG